MTDERWQGNSSAGSMNRKTYGNPRDDVAPSAGVSRVDAFGFLSESETGVDPDRSASGSAAKGVNGGALRPVPEPAIDDDTFPSEETEPPTTSRRDASAPAADTGSSVESRHDLSNHNAGRLILALCACAVAVAAFVVTRQALGRATAPDPAGVAVPARMSEEPRSSSAHVPVLSMSPRAPTPAPSEAVSHVHVDIRAHLLATLQPRDPATPPATRLRAS